MNHKARFFHAGCPVCVQAEQSILTALDQNKYDIEIIDIGGKKDRQKEAADLGVNSVPALVLDGQVFHINFGAALADVN